jgi:hypothetical protein
MADPLSVTASIADVLGLADLVIRSLLKYVKEVKESQDGITRLLSEMSSLYGVLHSLDLMDARFEDDYFTSTCQAEHVYSCIITRQEIKAKLSKSDLSQPAHAVNYFLKRLHWPYRTAEVDN